MYQIYFYVNLFNPLENSSIISQESLNKRTIKNCYIKYYQQIDKRMRIE